MFDQNHDMQEIRNDSMNASGKPNTSRPALSEPACSIQLDNCAMTSLQLAASAAEIDLRPTISPSQMSLLGTAQVLVDCCFMMVTGKNSVIA